MSKFTGQWRDVDADADVEVGFVSALARAVLVTDGSAMAVTEWSESYEEETGDEEDDDSEPEDDEAKRPLLASRNCRVAEPSALPTVALYNNTRCGAVERLLKGKCILLGTFKKDNQLRKISQNMKRCIFLDSLITFNVQYIYKLSNIFRNIFKISIS